MYGIFWSIVAKPEHKAEVVAFLMEDGAWSLANEPGTLRFDVYVDAQDPNRIWAYEAYADPGAFQVHRGGEYFAKWFADIMPRCIEGGVEPSMRFAYSVEPAVGQSA